MFKTLKPREWTILVFFKHLYFLPNVHHSFLKIGEILILMNKKAKRHELIKIVFYNLFEHIWLKNVALTKVVHIYVLEGMNA